MDYPYPHYGDEFNSRTRSAPPRRSTKILKIDVASHIHAKRDRSWFDNLHPANDDF
jgi:hypothetical protein